MKLSLLLHRASCRLQQTFLESKGHKLPNPAAARSKT